MNWRNKIILHFILCLASKNRVNCTIRELYWQLLNIFILRNINVIFKNCTTSIDYIRFRISIKALFHLKIKINTICKNIIIKCKYFAKTDFSINNLTCCIMINKYAKELSANIKLNQDFSVYIKLIKNRDSYEFFIKMPNVSINKYKRLFNGHLISNFMKSIYSDSKITIMCYYKLDNISVYPRVNYIIKYESLKIIPIDYLISKKYIVNNLQKKKHISNQYLNYDEIPVKIRDTIICTEDPSFYLHKGISPITIGFALRTDFNKKNFSVGGSSICMQLIKNALLLQERTLSRKIEEMILTLLMENYYKVDKCDILEIYLNMIEFAPNVYGIEDASLFYFDKHCSELNIIEIIILTYIIPRPNSFYKNLHNNTKQLNNNLYMHIQHYLKVLLNKKIITKEEISKSNLESIVFSKKFNNLHIIINKKDNNISIINELHPAIKDEVKMLLDVVNSKLTVSKMVIIEGLRTFNRQMVLYKKKDKITNAKAGYSYHNYGLAFDFCLSINGNFVWDEYADYDNDGIPDWSIVVDVFKKAGYTWGGNFKNIHDASHFEKTFGYSCKELYKKYNNGKTKNNYVIL
jgi:hypothetical protein